MSRWVPVALAKRLPHQEMTDQHRASSTRQPRSVFRQREAGAVPPKTKLGDQAAPGVEARAVGMPVVVALTGKVMPEQADTQVGALVEVVALRQLAQVRQPLNQTAALDTHGLMGRHTAEAGEDRMEEQQMEVQAALEVEGPQVSIQPQRARSTPEGEGEGLGLIQPQQAARAAPALSSSPFRGSCDGALR